TNTNYDKTLHSGVEFNSKFRLCSWLSIMSNYAFTEAIFKNGEFKKKKIPGIPVHKWTAGLDLNLPKHLYFYLGANYTGERYFLSDQKNEFPRLGAYATVDMKLSYKIDDYTLYTAVNNFFDENYSEYGVIYSDKKHYYPSRGRNFVIGGSVKF
ncbi:MAG: TonB-dependent receptor, partial [Candidatus Omnitrophica bacterium]|nr:TonB-dependent receptor [Candidatus Omnitrophota bacterium]